MPVLRHPFGGLAAVPLRGLLPALALLLAGAAHAARPLATDDAAVVAPGACQLELWGERLGGEASIHLQPGCNPFGRTELALGLGWSAESGERVGRWQLKRLLREGEGERLGLALALGGGRGPAPESRELFLNGIATVPLPGGRSLLHLNLAGIAERDAEGQRRRLGWGVALDRALGEASRLALEAHDRSGERARWRIGWRHEPLPGRLQLDGSLGAELGLGLSDPELTLGLVLFTDPFLR